MKVFIQANELNTLTSDSDSTIFLAKEAVRRGSCVFFFTPNRVHLEDGIPYAYAAEMYLEQERVLFKNHRLMCLNEGNVLMIRQNPPFNMEYITSLYILKYLSSSVFLINNPSSICLFPEKFIPSTLLPYTPPTIITCDKSKVKDFLRKYQKIIMKPLYLCGGQGVEMLSIWEQGEEQVDRIFESNANEYLIFQKFLVDIYNGDQRLIFVDGKFVGGFTRKPKRGNFLSNIRYSVSVERLPHNFMSASNKNIVLLLEKIFKRNKIFLAGVDIIQSHIIEINITSPTGLTYLDNFYHHNAASIFWDSVPQNFR